MVLPLLWLQQLVGVVAHEATSAPIKHPAEMTAVRDAWYITPRATV
jgi:hypothetical protein